MEILLNKKTSDKDLNVGTKVCYQNFDGIYNNLGIITEILIIDGIPNYLINTAFGAYLASELKLIK